MASVPRDDNRIPVIAGVSSVDLATPTPIRVNPTTGGLLISSNVTTHNRDNNLVSTSVTFVAGTTGSVSTHTIFTVTGDVIMGDLMGVVNTSLASGGGATVSLGTVSSSGIFATNYAYTNWTVGSTFTDSSTPSSGLKINSFGPSYGFIIGNSDNITYTIGTAPLTDGKITFYILWTPLSTDGLIVAT